MQLIVRLIFQLIGVVLLCLLITAGAVMSNVHRSLGEETAASSERVAHGLANLFWREILWRESLRGDRLLLPSPDWETLETLKLVSPGVCVTFSPGEERGVQTLCSQTEGVGTPAPAWFARAYDSYFGPQSSVSTPVSAKVPGAVVVATAEPAAAVRQAWRQVSIILTFAVSMAFGICILAAAVVAHALAPTERVVAGLRRLADGDYRHRVHIRSKGEFRLIAGAVNDLAARLAQASAERVALTKRLFEVQEEERRALARDLHDEFGQCLTATIAFASSIKARANDRPDLVKDAEAVIRTAKRMMTTLREALARLRSQDLEEVGLESSLIQLVSGWNAETTPTATVHLDLLGDLDGVPQTVSTNVYRIAQECLTNAMRHGRPSDIRLRVERLDADGDFIALVVEDDGGGDPSRLANAPGHGILGVRERVAAFGGSMCIAPSARGVRVSARIPLTQASVQTTRIAA
jgi:two-component system, NarL family, sensor histidine kinase UhpB